MNNYKNIKYKKIPFREVVEHLKDSGDGFMILADTKMVEAENKTENLRSLGTESEPEYHDFVNKVKSLASKLDVNLRIKVIMIYNETGEHNG